MSRPARPVTPPVLPTPITWAEAVTGHMDALRLRHYAPQTLRVRGHHLAYFLAWAEMRGLTRPQAVTRSAVERYQRSLYQYRKRDGAPLAPASQLGRLVAVKGLFRWLTKEHHLRVNPAAEIELPRVTAQRLPQPLTDAEIAAVLAQPVLTTPTGLRDRALLEVLYSTGMRRMEVIALTLADCDLARGVVAIRAGKGQKDRVVPIGERAIAWLEQYVDAARPVLVADPDPGNVFLTSTGRPFHPNHLCLLTRRYVKRAGVTKRGACHLLRHTMATGMLEHGADVRVIQEILGHARLTTTQLYTKVSIRLLKAVHTATHPAATLGRTAPAERDPPARRRARARGRCAADRIVGGHGSGPMASMSNLAAYGAARLTIASRPGPGL